MILLLLGKAIGATMGREMSPVLQGALILMLALGSTTPSYGRGG
jgi:hypothetical protein